MFIFRHAPEEAHLFPTLATWRSLVKGLCHFVHVMSTLRRRDEGFESSCYGAAMVAFGIGVLQAIRLRSGKVPSFHGQGAMRGFSSIAGGGCVALLYSHGGWQCSGEQWLQGHAEAMGGGALLALLSGASYRKYGGSYALPVMASVLGLYTVYSHGSYVKERLDREASSQDRLVRLEERLAKRRRAMEEGEKGGGTESRAQHQAAMQIDYDRQVQELRRRDRERDIVRDPFWEGVDISAIPDRRGRMR